MKKNKRAYKLSPAAIAQRRAASKIAGEKRRKGPRKSVSLRADAADILRDAAKNRGLSKSEVIRRDVKYDPTIQGRADCGPYPASGCCASESDRRKP